MPKIKFDSDSDEEEFETEAFQYLNKEKQRAENDSEDSDSDNVNQDPDDDDDDHDDEQNDESDDEAPESIGFEESRKNVLSQFRSAMMQVDQERKKIKEKRKQKEVLFKEQKEKKLKYISETKLPDEILQDIDSAIPRNIKEQKKRMKRQQNNEGKEDDAEVKEPAQKKTKRKESHNKKETKSIEEPSPVSKEDYIPLVDNDSGIEVAEIRQYEKQVKSLAQRAADFRNSRLYSKDIPRETNKSRLLKLEKKKARMK